MPKDLQEARPPASDASDLEDIMPTDEALDREMEARGAADSDADRWRDPRRPYRTIRGRGGFRLLG